MKLIFNERGQMTLGISSKFASIEQMELKYTNDFLLEMAKVFRCEDMNEASFRLTHIAEEVSGWACNDDEGARELIASAEIWIEAQ